MPRRKRALGVFCEGKVGLHVSKLRQIQLSGGNRVEVVDLMVPEAPSPGWLRAKVYELDVRRIKLAAIVLGFPGENYASQETAIKTVGLVDPATRSERVATAREWMRLAKDEIRPGALYDAPRITFKTHLGVFDELPADEYSGFIHTVSELAQYATSIGSEILLETGRESSARIKQLISDVNIPDVLGANLDTANGESWQAKEDFVTYAKALGPLVRGVHLKYATRSATPGQWGQETDHPDSFVERVLDSLDSIDFDGSIIVEREKFPFGSEDQEAKRRGIQGTLEQVIKLTA